MKAQVLYDLRERTGFATATALHEFFVRVCGVPSPSGKVELPIELVGGFVLEELEGMFHNSPQSYAEVVEWFIETGKLELHLS